MEGRKIELKKCDVEFDDRGIGGMNLRGEDWGLGVSFRGLERRLKKRKMIHKALNFGFIKRRRGK